MPLNQIRDAGLRFDERSHHQFREAHAEGHLLGGLCAGVERHREGIGDPNRLRAVAQAIKRGLPTREDVLISRGAPWAPYMSPRSTAGRQEGHCGRQGLHPIPLTPLRAR